MFKLGSGIWVRCNVSVPGLSSQLFVVSSGPSPSSHVRAPQNFPTITNSSDYILEFLNYDPKKPYILDFTCEMNSGNLEFRTPTGPKIQRSIEVPPNTTSWANPHTVIIGIARNNQNLKQLGSWSPRTTETITMTEVKAKPKKFPNFGRPLLNPSAITVFV